MSGPLLDRLGEAFFKGVPSRPGVYLMLGQRDQLLYVGKAKNLRTRLRSYARLSDEKGDDERLLLLVSAVESIRWEEHATESLARGRETELLRAMRPPFNFTHTSSTEYLAIAVVGRGDRVRLRLSAAPAQQGERLYGCFPFAAATPDAFKALLRLLGRAASADGRDAPTRATRASGCDVELVPSLRKPLRDFLAGRSRRLLRSLEDEIRARAADDALVLRSAARDLEVLEPFYELGPRALRRLQERHASATGAVSPEQLGALLAREMAAQTGADIEVGRTAVEQRIAALRARGLGFRAIAARLNGDGVPRLRGGGRWRPADVAEVVGEQLARQTTTAALSRPV